MRTARQRLLLLFLMGALCLWFAAAASADSIESFRNGLVAIDQSEWGRAVLEFRDAIALDPVESEKRVFLSGVFSSPYLPHFYLGWSLYKLDQSQCEEALGALENSQEQAVVARFRKQARDLEEAMSACNLVVLPVSAAAASRALERASGQASTVAVPQPDPGSEDRRTAALAELSQAQAAFAEAETSRRVTAYREVERMADKISEDLAELSKADLPTLAGARNLAAQLETAIRSAETEISNAVAAREALMDLLAEPRWAAARSSFPEISVPQQAVDRLDSAKVAVRDHRSSLSSMQAAERDALLAAVLFDQMKVQAGSRLASWSQLAPPPEGLGIAANAADPSGRRALAASLPSTSSPSTSSERAARELADRVALALGLLSQVDEEAAGQLARQKSQAVRALVTHAQDATPGDLPRLIRRLEESIAALRLIEVAGAFFSGKASKALILLDAAKYLEGRLVAHAYLFDSAAAFHLFREGGETDATLLQRATEAAERSYALVDPVDPLAAAFSPSFREFFAGLAPTSG